MTPATPRPALYQVVPRQAGREPAAVPVTAFPFVIGRASDASLVLDGPGIWPRHLRLDLDPGEGLVASVEKGAIVTWGGEPLERRRLRHGDELRVGPVVLQFLVSPPARRSLAVWEAALWVVMAAMVVAQVLAALCIPRE